MIFYGLGIISSLIYMWYRKDRTSHSTAVFLFLATILFVVLGFIQSRTQLIYPLFSDILDALLALAPYVLTFVSIAIILHASRRLVKRGWSRKYGVLAILAGVLVTTESLIFMNRIWWRAEWLFSIDFLLKYFFLYLVITFSGFVGLAFLYRWIRPSLKQDYIIILGAGLQPDGTISLLLKHRLDEALRFYQKQIAAGETPARFIVSGGKGPDEPYSEAEAMQDYLMGKGIVSKQILVERNSINTHQNFLFSKEIMEETAAYRGIVFITNNFHVLRSRIYAHQLGIEAEGIGATTPLHYLPYALLREYIALLLVFRMYHVVAASLFLAYAWLFFR
ncbi:YdcF family protein [Jeotgalibaca caeni]|uniref:YdcF family protein n=1 Tax=Jeotgalibaca caeni TaxID=3028623 RepID=UPI00237DE712|nr:YdcF family protein [Jeotgalibaca caeni]MDE1549853.1 YdcF family protein [Jeotgalibaca caeni]